jgi:hypothetical protein
MGLFLTRDDDTASYAIIRHNIRTYQSAGVLAVVRGKGRAESELKMFEDSQDSPDRDEGWRYFIEKTALEPGTDPLKPPTVAKRNWKDANRKLFERQRLGSSLREILRDEPFRTHLQC